MIPNAFTASPTLGARTTRILLGKLAIVVGVVGRTFTEECGERPVLPWRPPRCRRELLVDVGLAIDVDDVDEAFEWECWCFDPFTEGCCGIERMLDIEEEVDLRPRRPAEERR
jgi:hypothetical protein